MTYLQTQVGVYRSKRYKDKNGKQRIGYTLRKSMPLEALLKDKTSYHLIKKYRKQKEQKLKEEIILFTPAGYYENERKEKEPLTEATGLVQIDIDAKTNTQIENWEEYRDYLFKTYKWIAIIGLSTSGVGLFTLANTTGPESYAEHFYALAQELEEKEGLTIDRAVSSPNELRYMTLPEDIKYRTDARVYKNKAKKPENKQMTQAALEAGTGKLVKVPEEMRGKMRRQDVLDYIMLNLHNGVSREELMQHMGKIYKGLLDKTSMLHDDLEGIDYLSQDLYRRYAEQFGQKISHKAKLTGSRGDTTIELEGIDTDKKLSHAEMWVMVVSEVLQKYKIFSNESGLFQFDKTHWKKIPRPVMGQFLRNCAIEMGINPSIASGHKFVEGLLKQIDIDSYNEQHIGRRDKLNFINGTLNIETNKLNGHNPDDYLFYCLEFEYNPKMDCPKFTEYLNFVLPSKEDQRMVLSYLGACFSDVKFEHMLCLLGDGGNGKSVLLDVLSGVLGPDNVCHVNMDNIAGYGSSADNYRLMLENKIINVSSESRFKNIDFSTWKQLASHEPVTAHKFHRDRFEMRSYARTIYAMNSLPTNFEEHNDGFFRRLLIVQFKVKIEAAQRNINLAKEIIHEEAVGVMNKIVEAIKTFKREGAIHQSKDSKEFVSSLELKNDSVQQYLDHIQAEKDVTITVKNPALRDVYKSYRFFCEDELYVSPVGRNKFVDRLERLGVYCRKAGKGTESTRRIGIIIKQ